MAGKDVVGHETVDRVELRRHGGTSLCNSGSLLHRLVVIARRVSCPRVTERVDRAFLSMHSEDLNQWPGIAVECKVSDSDHEVRFLLDGIGYLLDGVRTGAGLGNDIGRDVKQVHVYGRGRIVQQLQFIATAE